jgi:hypothetical protein
MKVTTIATTVMFGALAAGPALAASAIGLSADGRLVPFDTATRKASAPVAVKGTDGPLLGIDVRPADGKLYGITAAGSIYTLDSASGAATLVSRLNKPFAPGGRTVVDFNPQADRLRLLGQNGTSFRVNVQTGEVTVDGSLRYADTDANKARKPAVTAAAYTNAMPAARGTELIDLDTGAGVMALQSPPNDGVLQTRGKLGAKLGANAAFDIMLDRNMDNVGFIVSGRTLYSIDLDKGGVKKLGKVERLPAITDLALLPEK